MFRTRKRMILAATVLAVSIALTACGGGGKSPQAEGGSSADPAKALEKGGKLTIWSWEGTLKQVVKDFNAEHPGVTVELVNAGSGNKHYTALQNAVSAGSGGPDIAQVEYFAIPQFAMSDALVDLKQFGAAGLADKYTPGPWSSVNFNGGIYGLPMDSGPIAMFYNKKLFDKHGIKVPKTWSEFVQAGRDLKAKGAEAYITNDLGNAGVTQALIWQAGGKPYQVDGSNVKLDLADDPGVKKYADMWQKLIDDDLLAPIDLWSDEWYQGLADGKIATLIAGAWMPANLASGVKSGAGDWRAAPVPQWTAGENVSAEHGGSSLAIMKGSKNAALAYAFLEYANLGKGVQTRVDLGAFPAATAPMQSDKFAQEEFDYFGGQKANQIFIDSAANVRKGWSFLPFQVYANSVFNDTVGQAYTTDTTMAQGLKDWQKILVQYGKDQGFTMK